MIKQMLLRSVKDDLNNDSIKIAGVLSVIVAALIVIACERREKREPENVCVRRRLLLQM